MNRLNHAVRIKAGRRVSAAIGAAVALVFGCSALCDAKTWTVTTTADSATDTGSLRCIVSKAGKGDTIKFSSGGATLTGVLALDKKLTIQGPATIRQTGGNRIFYILAGGNVTLKKLTLSGGGRDMGEGGAIRNDGSLKMEDCTITKNRAAFEGGGVFSQGTLTMKNCVVENNTSDYRCGGIWNTGKLDIDGGAIRNNACGSGGCSAIYNAGGASAKIEDCDISNNTGSGGPGGISNEGDLEMESCTVTSHGGISSGGIENTGTLKLKNCSITGNRSGCNGGGIYNNSGVLTAEACLISGNSAQYRGGGIFHLNSLSDPKRMCHQPSSPVE